ncbi:NifU-like domain family protein [Babesia bovis T2Bo]|uniref:NifU-like domain family protein n=1 Tax=Babesia bovis T2Bo TaxID=484906 RepID=UPI001DCF8D26|nr:NifU-like domain family protein [Babesia bovis T2Bo]KAG6439893.1 NifU-like domain family protein [Babesia bovis T2Bo]
MIKLIFALLSVCCILEATYGFKQNGYNVPPRSGRLSRIKASDSSTLRDINATSVEDALDLVRPQIAAEGGQVSLEGINDHEILIKMHGKCKNCAYRMKTVKSVIEATLIKFLKSEVGKQITVKVVDD